MLSDSGAGNSAASDVSDFRNCVLSITGSPTANLKVFVMGAARTSDYGTAPDFTIRSSARNEVHNWDFVEVVDLQDGTAIDGDTGIDLNGNVIRIVEVNVNSLDWLAVRVTSVSAGTVTVVGAFTTNE